MLWIVAAVAWVLCCAAALLFMRGAARNGNRVVELEPDDDESAIDEAVSRAVMGEKDD